MRYCHLCKPMGPTFSPESGAPDRHRSNRGRSVRPRAWGAIRFLILAGTLSFSAGGVVGDDPVGVASPADPTGPYIEMSFEESPRINSVAFSATGDSVYVLLNPRAINVWNVLVYHYPIVLGAIVVIVTLFSALRIRKTLLSRRIVGARYCRKCNYCVDELPSSRCPECGNLSAGEHPVIGKPVWKRITPTAAILCGVLLPYASMLMLSVPRTSRVNDWFNWWSVDLADWATDRGILFLIDRTQLTNRIVEVDAHSGMRERILLTKRGYTQIPIVTSPDGGAIVLQGSSYGTLEIIDATSARVIASIEHPWDSGTGPRSSWQQVCGFSDDGDTVYAVWLNWEDKKTKLIAWHWRTGSYDEVIEIDAEVHAGSGREMVFPQRFFLIPGQSSPKVIQFPSGYQVDRGGVELFIRDLDDPATIRKRLEAPIWPYTEPSFSSTGERMYFLTWPGWGITLQQRDLDSDAARDLLGGWGHGLRTTTPVFDSRRHLIFVALNRPGGWFGLLSKKPTEEYIAVYDVEARKTVAELPYPPRLLMMNLELSPDGHTLAAVGFRRATPSTGRNRVHELLLYDVSDVGGIVEPTPQ